MYSAARSRRLGTVHSPLVELSGVGGGRDPVVGVKPLCTGTTRALIVVGLAPVVGYKVDAPLGAAGREV